MKLPLFILLAMLVVCTPVPASAFCVWKSFGSSEIFTESDAKEYKFLCDYLPCGIAVGDDGAWGAGCGYTDTAAKFDSVSECKKHSSQPDTCRVVDLNQESDFIKSGISKAPRSNPSPDSDRQLLSTGTGFLVNKNFIATADHVLRMNDRGDVCNSVSVMYRHDEYQTTIADLDPANDIGLLKLSKPISSTAKIRNDPDLRLGETAINYGFPLSGELSTSAKITSGAVNSLAGYNNNSAFIQYDAASQFGNSGGPVLDASGNVIGVVSAKLDDSENQLVNFATKSTILEGFLKANKVPFEKADLTEELKLPDIAEKAEAFTVLVGCWE
jgi:S1-C subfamily serine protease